MSVGTECQSVRLASAVLSVYLPSNPTLVFISYPGAIKNQPNKTPQNRGLSIWVQVQAPQLTM